MTDDNKTHEYYIVKWDRPPHELQEETDIFQAGDVVWNAKYLNPIQQSRHWYTQSTIKTIVRVQNVLAENLDLRKPSFSIKLPNTCNLRETIQKGEMKLPDRLHKGLLDEIINRGALDFIGHDKYVHQYEEEDSINDASVISYDKEK